MICINIDNCGYSTGFNTFFFVYMVVWLKLCISNGDIPRVNLGYFILIRSSKSTQILGIANFQVGKNCLAVLQRPISRQDLCQLGDGSPYNIGDILHTMYSYIYTQYVNGGLSLSLYIYICINSTHTHIYIYIHHIR